MKKYARPVFDRRHRAAENGKGDVEILIRITPSCKKYVKVTEATSSEYQTIIKNKLFLEEVDRYNRIATAIVDFNEELSTEHLNERLGLTKIRIEKEQKNESFLDWMYEEINKTELQPSTITTHLTTWKGLTEFGKIVKFQDLTSKNLYLFDDWLFETKHLKDCSKHNYHKILNRYCKKAYERGILSENPYMKAHFTRGKYKERNPLTEDEIIKIRDGKFFGVIQKAADLFIFSCYTGLAYADLDRFEYSSMTVVKEDKLTYIDGSRVKTGSNFYTPILPPAMKILQKYNYKLPHIVNQKYNYYLKVVQESCGITKKLTTHLARHSFATLMLAHGCTMENLARMLGHKDIRTTQIYGKILKQTIENQIANIYKTLL